MSELPASAKRVQDAARVLGLAIAVREMAEPTRTAEEAAAACGVTVGQIVKSLVFLGGASGRPYLLLVSGANRVNEKGGVARHLGEKLKRPDADAVRALTGYAIGGIPPFGHDTAIATWMITICCNTTWSGPRPERRRRCSRLRRSSCARPRARR